MASIFTGIYLDLLLRRVSSQVCCDLGGSESGSKRESYVSAQGVQRGFCSRVGSIEVYSLLHYDLSLSLVIQFPDIVIWLSLSTRS